jgi:hypothetical protein
VRAVGSAPSEAVKKPLAGRHREFQVVPCYRPRPARGPFRTRTPAAIRGRKPGVAGALNTDWRFYFKIVDESYHIKEIRRHLSRGGFHF